jgi:type VI secretion system secreted protein Hcp
MAEGDLFIKITGKTQGEIKGESLKTGKEGQTEIAGFNIGAHQPGSFGVHSGGGTGKVTFSDVNFSAYVSKQSINIFKAMGNHEALSEVILSARKGVGDKQEDYFVATLTDVVMTDYSVSVSEHGAPVVNGNLNYKKIKIQYKEQKPDQTLGPWIEYEFDQAMGQAAG